MLFLQFFVCWKGKEEEGLHREGKSLKFYFLKINFLKETKGHSPLTSGLNLLPYLLKNCPSNPGFPVKKLLHLFNCSAELAEGKFEGIGNWGEFNEFWCCFLFCNSFKILILKLIFGGKKLLIFVVVFLHCNHLPILLLLLYPPQGYFLPLLLWNLYFSLH